MSQSHHQTEPHSGPNVPTFEDAATKFLELTGHYLGPGSSRDSRAVLQTYAFPYIGTVPVSDLTPEHVLGTLRPIWYEKPSQARRVRSLIRRVLAWACASGFRTDNLNFAAIASALPRQPQPVPRRWLPHSEVASVLAAARGSKGLPSTRLAFEFLVLTAARSGEACGARWDEMDLKNAVWTMPAERMKSRRVHRVPLSEAALAVLANARELGSHRGPVFPNRRGGPLSASSLSNLLRSLGVNAVPHSFRSTFRQWCAETGVLQHLAELSLGHDPLNPHMAVNCRLDWLDDRREIMEAWGTYIGPPSSR